MDASLHVSKLAAAQRQLDAAIRMTLAAEDKLAIHTVAAAAYQILRDLKKKRERNELSDRLSLGIFGFANDLASGKEIPPSIAKNRLLAEIVESFSEAIRSGEVRSEKDVASRLKVIGEKSHWAKFDLSANLLKHADRFPNATIHIDSVDNDLILMHAIPAYVELMGPKSSTPEMMVYGIFLRCVDESSAPKMQTIAGLPDEKRRRACLSLLKELKRRGPIAFL